tara:strand:- start:3368 stop:3973 length:606 start_codon:yes stop_codon:yes gene_type:complete
MGDFVKYLSESVKQYDYRIKIAGEIDKDFGTKLETGLQKFEVAKLSAGKTTPIQETPLDFPMFKNTNVTIFELTTNYPASVFEMQQYIAEYMGLAKNQVVVRKPNEPSEEYQADMGKEEETTEFRSVLQDVEYKDTPELPKEKEFGDKANQSLFKELLKDRKEKVEAEKKETTQKQMDKDEKGTPSPFSKPKNPHPDPKRA